MVQLLGINVRHLRHQKGISQEALADKTGIFRTYLSRIETGRSNPTLAVLDALAGALDVLPHSLLLPME
jgi:transcriptional regulator with XRE-family HTH domain